MLILFWDIDGTLLTTNRAGILAWEGATQTVLGQPPDFSTLETAGLTDIEIAGHILTRFELPAEPEHVTALVRRYEALLPGRLPERAGRVLPGVREVLDHLRDCRDVRSFLLTGNTAAGGRAKLRHYGLDGYFDHGAFADGAPDRPAIARRALGLARELVGRDLVPTRLYVIGDTPHDVRCAREIGARSVAVASGTYTVADLRRHDPWWVLERLPDPVAFLERLRLGTIDGTVGP
ncbi:MAG: HAD family hydrolase [Candidatus Rokuibacteriota bacterium]